jgi:hypothetical protein
VPIVDHGNLVGKVECEVHELLGHDERDSRSSQSAKHLEQLAGEGW